ncbi:MAG: SIMPL domain-containing protein, partial [candidate division Zixibacteria bacterium]|nr:SIMPL domain-containing protein [candidate division Zixibacteria bacterium]
YKDQARVLAVRAAKEKAIGLARELGQKIGKPYKIQEERVEWWSWYGMNQNVTKPGIVGDFLGNEGSIALGQINVTAKITVSFELE